MKNKIFVFAIIVFILSLSIRIFWITQKQGLHVDEMFTRTTIVGKRVIGDYVLNSGIDLNYGKDIKHFFFAEPKLSLAKDLENLRKDNYADDAHPSLYYSIVRTFLPLSENSLQGFIYLGCGLNLIFFTFSFFIMRKILIRLFGDNKLVPIGLIFAFLNTGTISMTLFIRPYELQILAFTLITYVYLLFKDKIKQNQSILNLRDITFLIFSLTFTFLSGYFLILYVAMLAIILLYHSRKNVKNLAVLLMSALLAFVFCCVIYNGYFQFLDGQRFVNLTDDRKADPFNAFLMDIISFFCNITKFFFYGLTLTLILIFCPFMKKVDFKAKSLILTAFLWSIVVSILSPYLVVRYMTPALPVMSLLLVWITAKIKDNKQNLFIGLTVFIYIICSIFPLKNESYDTMILYKNHSLYVPWGGRIENLYIADNPAKKINLPVVILNTSKTWFAPLYLIPKLNNNQKYTFIISDTKYNLNALHFKHYYLFIDKNNKYSNYFGTNVKGYYVGDYYRYKCYEIFVNN